MVWCGCGWVWLGVGGCGWCGGVVWWCGARPPPVRPAARPAGPPARPPPIPIYTNSRSTAQAAARCFEGVCLAILPSSLLSRVFPGSERMPFTSKIGAPPGSTGLRRANAGSWISKCRFGAETPFLAPHVGPRRYPNLRHKFQKEICP